MFMCFIFLNVFIHLTDFLVIIYFMLITIFALIFTYLKFNKIFKFFYIPINLVKNVEMYCIELSLISYIDQSPISNLRRQLACLMIDTQTRIRVILNPSIRVIYYTYGIKLSGFRILVYVS